ncbi:heterogeneous nuclear ribonucleoprotein 1-like [Miscanthus floridulus]|uniref:heterogeneous nuclear ribonucleoprotein 1-like n=1 Tax=Miscanthus floridulus TaxID=154761 RepID=UPI0034593390
MRHPKLPACVMKLPESNGRLFVAGIAPGTGDADIRRHFCRYGEVSDVCQPNDRLTGCPRGFAFVQFPRPIDAGRALADPHHVSSTASSCMLQEQNRELPGTSLSVNRIYGCGKRGNCRVGDMIRISLGPLGDDYEDCEYVNKLKGFGDISSLLL